MIYFIKQTPSYSANRKRIKILLNCSELSEKIKHKSDCLVLVDDILGTGRTIIKFFERQVQPVLSAKVDKTKIKVLCIVYMSESKKLIQSKMPFLEIYGSESKEAFASRGSVFGYRKSMVLIREFCYKYGLNLYFVYDEDKDEDVPHPLGYYNSQSLIVFAHSTPNNTLPIIWSDLDGWSPIFPRFGEGKIANAKKFRNETRHWISIAYKHNILGKRNVKKKVLYNNRNYKLLAVIRLKKNNRLDTTICQIMGFSSNEYAEVIKLGIKKDLFENNGRLSKNGENVYDEIYKILQIANNEKVLIKNDVNGMMYVPNTFLGRP
jgi:hypothetical protein